MNIIVSFTSWTKRIGQAKATVDSIINQTRKPDRIELNLDVENFPNGFQDTPDWVREYTEKYENFYVYFNLKDLKVYSKLVPTIVRHAGEQYILVTLDDDVTYPDKYLEEIETNMKDCDWLCTKSDEFTMGQYCVYGPSAITAFLMEIDMDLIENVPLDDHALFWIMHKYKLKRGKKTSSEAEDRQQGYSFRRYFVNTDKPEELLDTSCGYPQEQFEKERAYMHKRGIV